MVRGQLFLNFEKPMYFCLSDRPEKQLNKKCQFHLPGLLRPPYHYDDHRGIPQVVCQHMTETGNRTDGPVIHALPIGLVRFSVMSVVFVFVYMPKFKCDIAFHSLQHQPTLNTLM